MVGVSPSFFFSSFSTDFSVDDYKKGLENLKNLGFSSYQGEIFYENKLKEWENQASELLEVSQNLNISMSAFVSHFLIHYFETSQSLFSDDGYTQFQRVCSIVKKFENVNTLILPIGSFTSTGDFPTIEKAFFNRIKRYCEIAKNFNLQIALEILPHSLVGGVDGFLRLIEKIEIDNLGYNFDTGHANCSGEILSLIPQKLKGKIYSTHLKDNFGEKNLSLPPGRGSIDWKLLLKALKESGYNGTFDLEINSNQKNVDNDYSEGLNYLKSLGYK